MFEAVAALLPGGEREDAARHAHLRAQQLRLLCQQWTRTPFAIAVAIGFVVYTAWERVPGAVIGSWAALILALLFARRPYVQHLLREPPANVERAMRHMLAFAFGHGVMIGAAAIIAFPHLPVEGQALLTMVLVCWTGGGVATAAAYARAFHVFAIPALLPLAVLWALAGSPGIATLIVLFGLIQIFFVRDNERVVRESFLIRFENERLIEALERERREVTLARDSAEEASRAKSRFLAAASHDLRQPLHALSMYSAALGLHVTDADGQEIAGQMGRALASLSALLDALLDVSKLDAGAIQPLREPFDVSEVIEQVEAEYRPRAQEKGLAFLAAPVSAMVLSDRPLLERIVRNLVDNAVKHTAAGSVTLIAERDSERVRIEVRDTGPGIAEAEHERVFEEFYQVDNAERDRSQGLGLGLAIVRRLCALLGIELELKSGIGRGSVFALTLERVAGHALPGPVPRPEPLPEARLDGVRVLVIDDEPAVRWGMKTLLGALGCRVVVSSGLEEALVATGAGCEGVDLIVADYRLRRNESGIETVRSLRARLGQVPALLVTGDTSPDRVREAEASGLPLLYKPVSGDVLGKTLQKILGR